MLKIHCPICLNLLSYHNRWWTCPSNHILSHKLLTPEAIVAAATLASEGVSNIEVFLAPKLPIAPELKKEAPGDVVLMRCTIAASSYSADTTSYDRLRQSIVKWKSTDCLPYKIVDICTLRNMVMSLDPKDPNFSRTAKTYQVRIWPCHYFLHISSIYWSLNFHVHPTMQAKWMLFLMSRALENFFSYLLVFVHVTTFVSVLVVEVSHMYTIIHWGAFQQQWSM